MYKTSINKIVAAGIVSLALVVLFPGKSSAGISLNYDLSVFTNGGNNLNGSLLLISHGVNGVFSSGGGWSVDTTSFLLGDDTLLATVNISNGYAVGALYNITIPTGSIAGTQFTSLFIDGLLTSQISSTGNLLGGLKFGTGAGATTYSYGTYRSDTVEAFGGDPAGKIAFIIPADGSTNDFWVDSAVGTTGASLGTFSSVSIVPEPSTGALMMIGAAGLVALRRLRKV